MCNAGQNWNHRSRSRESETFSKSRQIYYQKFPCDLTKKMITHTLCFLSTNKKATGVWNSEGGSRKSMEKAEDIQFRSWNTTYIFTAVKYNFLLYFHVCEIQLSKICIIIFNQYFSVFHYFVYNKYTFLLN